MTALPAGTVTWKRYTSRLRSAGFSGATSCQSSRTGCSTSRCPVLAAAVLDEIASRLAQLVRGMHHALDHLDRVELVDGVLALDFDLGAGVEGVRQQPFLARLQVLHAANRRRRPCRRRP